MGEQFIRNHAKKFEHLQCAAFEQELRTRHLFSQRPETLTLEFSCRPVLGALPADMSLLNSDVFVKKNNLGAMEVILGNRVIATIEGPSAFEAISLMNSDSRCCGMIAARVHEQSPISGYFTIRCTDSEELRGEQ